MKLLVSRLSKTYAKTLFTEEIVEDNETLEQKAKLKNKKLFLDLFYKSQGKVKEDDTSEPCEFLEKDEMGITMVKKSVHTVHPLYFLTSLQIEKLLKSVRFVKVKRNFFLYGDPEQDKKREDKKSAYILLDGEVHFFSYDGIDFKDLISPISLFGYDGPVFDKRLSKALAIKDTLLAEIKKEDFLDILEPFSKFASYLSRIIYLKDKVLDSLNDYKNFILASVDQDYIDMKKAIKYFREIDSCLHVECGTSKHDFTAWTYALNRLPPNIINTYFFILVNEHPNILRFKEYLSDKISMIQCKARPRSIYSLENGKDVIILRDLEADVLDFVSNMCIHLVESNKLRKKISSPLVLEAIVKGAKGFDNTIQILREKANVEISSGEETLLRKYFGERAGRDFGKELISMSLNHQDVAIQIIKKTVTDKDAVEKWAEYLWAKVKESLGTEGTLEEIPDLVVDICQGSKSTLLNCLSSHLYSNKHSILNWAHKMEESENDTEKLTLVTKEFLNSNDKLVAYAFYYYLKNIDKANERDKANSKNGIIKIEQTFGTGVKIVIINVNKLNQDFIDPNIHIKPASKNHIILHIGYTFGNQAKDIINPVLMLFGKHCRSLNILGKAGGLVGKRTDILIADKIFWDKNNDLTILNTGNPDIKKLEEDAKAKVHVGPMLTVAGTILQNYDLLNYYKNVNGCVGLEMEGFYYAKEVENAIKAKLIREDFICRFLYYTSDCPLVASENLANEGLNVSWDEGICSMNAVQRFVLNQIFDN